MTDNIFDRQANENIQERLEKLSPNATPLWGKMTVAQMVLHCQKPIDVAFGKLQLKRSLLGLLFGKWAKNSFMKKKEFGKNSPTAPEFKIVTEPDFESEKQALLEQVKQFKDEGANAIANKYHPFFGLMTDVEWGSLHYAHLDHHLKQFGL